jgi:histidinol-phosphate aminotransferase
MFDLNAIIRPNVRDLKPYSSARDEFSGEANIWLDANESPYENGLNRYPDPLQRRLKKSISALKGLPANQIFLGNGSDEAIDLLIRAFCTPGTDRIITLPPTYGMYAVSAAVNDVGNVEVPLTDAFQIDLPALQPHLADPKNKLIFICSPNNPTGNLMDRNDIRDITSAFQGIVVVDEAYIDFASEPGVSEWIATIPNLVVLQTFSKAWGMAGARLGMAFAQPESIAVLNRIKPPYNINTLTQKNALERLSAKADVESEIAEILVERKRLETALTAMDQCMHVYPGAANFILAQFKDADNLYAYLCEKGIVVRSRTKLIRGALRITVGTPKENEMLLEELNAY